MPLTRSQTARGMTEKVSRSGRPPITTTPSCTTQACAPNRPAAPLRTPIFTSQPMPLRASSVPRLSAFVRQLASGTNRAARRTALACRTTVACSPAFEGSAGAAGGKLLRTRWNGANHSASRTLNTSDSAPMMSHHSAAAREAGPPVLRCLLASGIVSARIFARQARVGEIGQQRADVSLEGGAVHLVLGIERVDEVPVADRVRQ